MTKELLNFYIQYAINVLELEASLRQKIGTLSKLLSYLSGTAIVASAINQSPSYAIVFSIIFALGQCIDFVYNPQALEQKAKDFCKQYKLLLLLLPTQPEGNVEIELKRIQSEDDIKVSKPLKDYAYNLTTDQLNFDEKSKYQETKLIKLVKWFL